jgi:formylglycine-generating enzyme required for sulfatase activity
MANERPPTEAEYTDAMSRHGTDSYTKEDADLVDRYLQHKAELREPQVQAKKESDLPQVGEGHTGFKDGE